MGFTAPDGSTPEYNQTYTTQMENMLLQIPEVSRTVHQTGSGRGSISVQLKPWEERTRKTQDIIQDVQKQFRENITGGQGNDLISGDGSFNLLDGGAGNDTLTGGAGADVFVFNNILDGRDTITDFAAGTDKLDLTAIATTLRTTYGASGDLLANGYVRLVDTANGVEVRIDTDGTAGAASPIALVLLKGVSASQIVASRDLML